MAPQNITPLSDDGTMARRLHRFKATLSSIREKRESTHCTARRTITHSSKRTHKHVACGLCKKHHRLVTCSKFTKINIHGKFDAVSTKYKARWQMEQNY